MPRLCKRDRPGGLPRARRATLLAHQVPPEEVHWQTVHAPTTTSSPTPAEAPNQPAAPRPAAPPPAIVPASFLRLCEFVVLHHDPQRFALLYRLLWRLVHEPGLRNDPLDADMLQAQQMAQAVRRDMHKMKAFLRFRAVPDGSARRGAARGLVRARPPRRRSGRALVRAAHSPTCAGPSSRRSAACAGTASICCSAPAAIANGRRRWTRAKRCG